MTVVACLLPVALYCFILGLINSRRHPLLVRGPWDFAGVLLAGFGILAVAIPAVLDRVLDRWRLHWMAEGPTSYIPSALADRDPWLLVVLPYFLLLAGASCLLLWRRRYETSVYNVEPAVMEEILASVLNGLGLRWFSTGPRYAISRTTPDATSRTALYLDLVPLLRHATLCWDPEGPDLRADIESHLAKVLADVPTHSNPVGGWLLLAATFLAGFTLVAFAFSLALRIFPS